MNVKLRVLSAGALFFLGQASFAQKAKKDTTANIKQIDEVVVLGYNNKRVLKESNSAATIVTPELLENRPNINALQSLQGQAPGLYIASSSGSPGSNRFAAQIRGMASLNGSTNPLYVIDGVPVSETYWKNLNPDDITSISVLKDADATSIFGNRGANGVILVTTKAGKYNQKLTFTYSGQTGVTMLQKHNYDIADARQTLQFEHDNEAGKGAELTQDQINNWNLNTNWKKIFFRAGFSQNHNLAIQGGSENLGMYTSINYLNQGGIVPNTDFQRFGLRTNINGKTKNDRFTYQFNVGLNFSRRNQLEQETRTDIDENILQNPLQGLLTSLPYMDPNVYVNGQKLFNDFGSPSFQITPYMLMDYLSPSGTIRNRYDEFRLLANAVGNYKITSDLTFGVQAGADYTSEFRNFARAPWAYLAIATQGSQQFGGIENQINARDFNFNFNARLNYHKTFNDVHTLDVSVFSEYLRYTRSQSTLQQTGLDPKTWVFGAGTGWVAFNPANPTQYGPQIAAGKNLAGLYSYFGNFSYDYDKRYGVSGTIRRDASYKFIAGNKWGTFWSVGARWNISSEDFMNDSPFTLLKLRASYGTQGNQNILDATRGQQALGLNPIYLAPNINRDLGSTTGSGYGLNSTYNIVVGNPDVKWETIKQGNIGIDFDIKNGLLTGAIDAYHKKTVDMFNVMPISGAVGQYQLNGNFGDMVNKGVELSLRSNIIKKQNFGITVFANASYNENKILRLPTGNVNPANPFLTGFNSTATANDRNINAEGHLAYEYFMVPFVGINKENGNLQFLDKDGNITENPTNNDRRFTGKSFIPKYQGGFGANFTYHNFYLDTYFTFAAKVWRVDSDLQNLSDPNNIGVFAITKDLLNAWTPDNKNSDYPGLNAQSVTLGNTFSDRFLRDSSYLRLRNVSLGYNVSKDLAKSIGFSNFKVFVQAENLVTWTSWRGFDAESSSSSTSGGYPTPRIFTFGIEAQF